MLAREVPAESRRSALLVGAVAVTVLLWGGCATRGKPEPRVEQEAAPVSAQGEESQARVPGSTEASNATPVGKPQPKRAAGDPGPVPYLHPASPNHIERLERGLRPLRTISTGSTKTTAPPKSEQNPKVNVPPEPVRH